MGVGYPRSRPTPHTVLLDGTLIGGSPARSRGWPPANGSGCYGLTWGVWCRNYQDMGRGAWLTDSAQSTAEGLGGTLEERVPPPDRGPDLMERIRDGDAAAFGELIDLHWEGLVRYAALLTRSLDEGEDVAQSVFVQVWEARAEWTCSGSPAGYLFRIARNLSVNRVRRATVRKKSAPELARRWVCPPSPLDCTALSEFEAALEEAVSELPERRRMAFELVRFQGLSLDDAGAAMGVARQTVANHLYLASQQLLKRLDTFLA